MKSYFMTSVADAKRLPPQTLPEIAFAGRSNVGKSSLMNTILDRKNLVKVGKTPGKTRLLNFFNVGEQMIFVDLPGYGYAAVSKHERAKWGSMIDGYFRQRTALKMCLLLIDIRREIDDEEHMILDMLHHYGVTPCLVLTKSDKLSSNQLLNNLHRHARDMGVDVEDLIHFSSVNKNGQKEVRQRIAETIGTVWE